MAEVANSADAIHGFRRGVKWCVTRSKPVFPILALLLAGSVASADSIIVTGMGPQKVNVTGFANGQLSYVTDRGDAGTRDYARVQQLVVDNEPALSSAEAKAANKQTEAALDDYTKAIRSTGTAWVKAFAARRISDLAGPGGRFEAKLAAFLALTQIGAADAPAARPALPERGSRLLDVAVGEVETALKASQLPDAAKVGLLDFLVALQERRGDDAAVVAAVERLARSSPAAANDPVVQSRLVGLKVTQARAALDRKEYAAAAKLIDDTRATIVDPKQQADALFVLASAKQAVTEAADKKAQQDVALAFMRVVAVANGLPGRPNVLASLRAVAGILERTGDAPAAVKVYRQIARDFADDPAAAAEAKADAERISK